MANARSDCNALTSFLQAQGNTIEEIAAMGIQGPPTATVTFDFGAAARKKPARGGKKKTAVAKGGKKKAGKAGKKTAKGSKKKMAKGGKKTR